MSRPNVVAPACGAVFRRLEDAPADQQAAWAALWKRLLIPRSPGKEKPAGDAAGGEVR